MPRAMATRISVAMRAIATRNPSLPPSPRRAAYVCAWYATCRSDPRAFEFANETTHEVTSSQRADPTHDESIEDPADDGERRRIVCDEVQLRTE